MTEQQPLFLEDLDEAIRQTIHGLGGMKKVGHALRPEMSAVDAGKWLANCLNEDKRDRLSPAQLAYIRRAARVEGVHILAAYEAQDAGYAPPVPIEPEDERALLQREFVQASKGFLSLVSRMERVGLKVAS